MPSILIAEDSSPLRNSLCRFLEKKLGFSVFSVPDGSQAFDFFEASPCDLVLTDLQMEGGDGIDLISKLRAKGHKVPIILMTGSQVEAENILALGASSFLPKPFQHSQLSKVINDLLSFA